jgi:salicylate hydroxylase
MEECEVGDGGMPAGERIHRVTEMVGATEVGARWALHDLAPLKRWHTNRVVLMGDAAHAMVPHQGQGANATIEDAIVLARALATADDVPGALRLYTAIQRRRTTAIQWLARRTADLLHLPDGPDIAARDALFAELDTGLAWIHSYDASQRRAHHAARNRGRVVADSARAVPTLRPSGPVAEWPGRPRAQPAAE